MKCPTCSYSNATGAAFCQMCYEPFNKSAADRYLHAQKKLIRDQGRSVDDTPPPKAKDEAPNYAGPPRILKEIEKIDWTPYVLRAWSTVRTLTQTYARQLLIAAGVMAAFFLLLHFTSPAQRLILFGRHLNYRFSAKSPTKYFVSLHTEVKRWSERDHRLDTPLGLLQRDELANFTIALISTQKRTQKILLRPTEWILTQVGQMAQNVPLSHPSLAPVSITFKRGSVESRTTHTSFRIGRITPFVMPDWPSRNLRAGAEWDEPVEFLAAYGDWKILWRGRLRWRLESMTTANGFPCVYLTYKASVMPSLWETPAWARGHVSRVYFTGSGTGNALFDVRSHQLLNNDFFQEGMLSLPVNNIYSIPPEVRVGRMPRARYGRPVAAQPGVLMFQLKDKLSIHRS